MKSMSSVSGIKIFCEGSKKRESNEIAGDFLEGKKTSSSWNDGIKPELSSKENRSLIQTHTRIQASILVRISS